MKRQIRIVKHWLQLAISSDYRRLCKQYSITYQSLDTLLLLKLMFKLKDNINKRFVYEKIYSMLQYVSHRPNSPRNCNEAIEQFETIKKYLLLAYKKYKFKNCDMLMFNYLYKEREKQLNNFIYGQSYIYKKHNRTRDDK